MLKMRPPGPFAQPAILCDHCGQRITQGSEGVGTWLGVAASERGDGRLFYTHKRCQPAFTRAQGGGPWEVLDLVLLPAYLAASLELDWDQVRAAAASAVRHLPV